MLRPFHFEIPADDTARAMKFFTGVFGWKFSEWGNSGYHHAETGSGSEGIDGAIQKRNEILRLPINSIDVPSVDEYVEKVVAHGGTIVYPKYPIPTIGWYAYFKDTEGNVHGLFQDDPGAK